MIILRLQTTVLDEAFLKIIKSVFEINDNIKPHDGQLHVITSL